ncbi:cytochrome P450 78A7-like [Nicotiana sylvestris]|uniref:Cytochrome P450 78A7-like n=1 Tax=Nicotiana sylvestris TaxID=4096 RepID=A0A1U7XWQ6_NICSY|nr:PREDICTED: cytochrome P450 78A7-like [Nicotiana sylvestris]XP_016513831.1 PREDICTED: cytochrome P450 78A7-like [Nicotiana tabacum]
MSFTSIYEDFTWWMFALPAILETQNFFNLLIPTFVMFVIISVFTWAFTAGGSVWKNGLSCMGRVPIPGPKGFPIFGSLFSLSHGLAHRTLAFTASTYGATQVMAFTLGSTRAIVSSDPNIAREILTSPHFANRPVKESAKQLMFSRAIGFAPNGTYWRLLRKIASSHLFAPKRILAHERSRQLECNSMLVSIAKEQNVHGSVTPRKHLQAASLNNIMGIVFGKRYEMTEENNEAKELQEIVAEGFELLGAFNWCDHLPWLKYFYDPFHIKERCLALVPRVENFVKKMIQEHINDGKSKKISEAYDFVDVLLALSGEEKLHEDDMVAVLWEMIFRGTDTTALLTEWVIAELVLNQEIQEKLHNELETIVGNENVTDAHIAKLPYLQAVIKETLRLHPPGPLLSWSRLSTSDVHLSNGMIIPANTTAMINMWSITHDPNVWENSSVFKPERFLGMNFDVRGNDLRLAPFGAGRRVCPGKNLGLVTVSLWVAKLVKNFMWVENETQLVDLSEVLKLSCEMKQPLSVMAVPRNGGITTDSTRNWVIRARARNDS